MSSTSEVYKELYIYQSIISYLLTNTSHHIYTLYYLLASVLELALTQMYTVANKTLYDLLVPVLERTRTIHGETLTIQIEVNSIQLLIDNLHNLCTYLMLQNRCIILKIAQIITDYHSKNKNYLWQKL